MGIGIKTITGIGIAAAIIGASALPANAASNDAPGSTTTTNLTDIGLKITDLKTDSITATWDATKTYATGDSTSYCDIDLVVANGTFAGAITGWTTVTPGTNTVTFGSHIEDGDVVNSVTPGNAYNLSYTCYNNDGWDISTYQSKTITAAEAPVQNPTSTVARLINSNDIIAVAVGGFPTGEQWATSCLFRLYKDGALVQSKEIACNGGISYTFQNLAKGAYTVTTALRNSAGLSGWSPASNTVNIAAAASNSDTTVTSKTPGTSSMRITINGTKTKVHWGNAATRGNGKIAAYTLTITKNGHTVYTHKAKAAGTITKKLARGTYTIKVKVTNAKGASAVSSTKVKL